MFLVTRYAFPVLISAVSLTLILVYLASTTSGYDFTGHVIGRDFLNTHLGGVLISEGRSEVLFQPDTYWSIIKQLHGADYGIHNWSYPPLLWPLSQFLALFPYFWAYTIWTVMGVALVFVAVRLLGLGWIWGIFICLSPAGMVNILAGQNGFVFSSLLVIAMVLTHRSRSVSAGLTWAILAIKPHLGICVVPFLLASERYKTMAFGALFLVTAVTVSIFLYGTGAWWQFLTVTSKQQTTVVETWQGALMWMIPSGFMQGRLLGLAIGQAYTLHLILALVAAVVLWLRWPSGRSDVSHHILWLVLGTLIILPYSFNYDMVMFHFALALWYDRKNELLGAFSIPNLNIMFALLWLLPWIGSVLAASLSLQVTPLVLLLMLFATPALGQRGHSSSKTLSGGTGN